MTVGILVVHLHLPNSDSLKLKRQIILSLKARMKNRFNISISEIGLLNSLKETEIGICCISNNGRHIDRELSHIVKIINSNRNVEIIDYSTEKI